MKKTARRKAAEFKYKNPCFSLKENNNNNQEIVSESKDQFIWLVRKLEIVDFFKIEIGREFKNT